MRANINPLEPGARLADHRSQARIHVVEALQRKHPATDAGLIGDDDQPVALRIHQAQALRGSWQKFQAGSIVEIAAIDDQGAVAIEQDHAAMPRRGVHKPEEAARWTVLAVLCPGTSGASRSLPPRDMTRSAPTTWSGR